MTRVLCVVLAVAFLAAVPSITPAQGVTGLNGILKSIDAMDKNFDAADTNHDGLLSKDEAKAGHVPFIVSHFDEIDTQHRGLVSKQEAHAYIMRMLQQPASAASSPKPD